MHLLSFSLKNIKSIFKNSKTTKKLHI